VDVEKAEGLMRLVSLGVEAVEVVAPRGSASAVGEAQAVCVERDSVWEGERCCVWRRERERER
jgi:hypothetical protein